MTAYSYDNSGYYIGPCLCQVDPVRSNREGKTVYLLPANATFVEPPAYDAESEIPVWTGVAWEIELLPEPEPEPEQLPDTSPATEDRVAALEAENKTLKAKVSAQSEQMDFYEECIAEMASVVYA